MLVFTQLDLATLWLDRYKLHMSGKLSWISRGPNSVDNMCNELPPWQKLGFRVKTYLYFCDRVSVCYSVVRNESILLHKGGIVAIQFIAAKPRILCFLGIKKQQKWVLGRRHNTPGNVPKRLSSFSIKICWKMNGG